MGGRLMPTPHFRFIYKIYCYGRKLRPPFLIEAGSQGWDATATDAFGELPLSHAEVLSSKKVLPASAGVANTDPKAKTAATIASTANFRISFMMPP